MKKIKLTLNDVELSIIRLALRQVINKELDSIMGYEGCRTVINTIEVLQSTYNGEHVK